MGGQVGRANPGKRRAPQQGCCLYESARPTPAPASPGPGAPGPLSQCLGWCSPLRGRVPRRTGHLVLGQSQARPPGTLRCWGSAGQSPPLWMVHLGWHRVGWPWHGGLISSSHHLLLSLRKTVRPEGLANVPPAEAGQGRASPGKQGPEPRPSSYAAAAMGTKRATCVASGLASGSLERPRAWWTSGSPNYYRGEGQQEGDSLWTASWGMQTIGISARGTWDGPVGNSRAHCWSRGQSPRSPQSQESRPTGSCHPVAGS